MLATLPAVHCSPPFRKNPKNRCFSKQYQSFMPAKSCSPGAQRGGELKTLYYHMVMPAASTQRLTTCSPLADDTSRPSKTLPSNHHQKEVQ